MVDTNVINIADKWIAGHVSATDNIHETEIGDVHDKIIPYKEVVYQARFNDRVPYAVIITQ